MKNYNYTNEEKIISVCLFLGMPCFIFYISWSYVKCSRKFSVCNSRAALDNNYKVFRVVFYYVHLKNAVFGREERRNKWKEVEKLSNEHAIDLFMPFVATLSIWFVHRKRSISAFVCAIYWIFQLMRKSIHKHKDHIMARVSASALAQPDANAICLVFFFWSNVGGIQLSAVVCTNAYRAIDCDLSMSIYNEKLSICAWHVGNLYAQFHKWWNSVADVNKCAALHACAHTEKWGDFFRVVAVVVIFHFQWSLLHLKRICIRKLSKLSTWSFLLVCFIFVGVFFFEYGSYTVWFRSFVFGTSRSGGTTNNNDTHNIFSKYINNENSD